MKVICDTETNGLEGCSELWVIVCKDIDTGLVHTFRRPTLDPTPFLTFASQVTQWIGHNYLAFDAPIINRFLGQCIDLSLCVDTLVVSRLVDFGIEGGHSLEAWGVRLRCPKGTFTDYLNYSEDMVRYCQQDVEVSHRLYLHFKPYIDSQVWSRSLRTEHAMVTICQEMHKNGFYFNIDEARRIFEEINGLLGPLDDELRTSFPPRLKPIREIIPRTTKHGTLSRTDFRWKTDGDLSDYSEGAQFTLCEWETFNPGSTRQIVERLNAAGWKPFEKTKGHIQCERDLKDRRDRRLSEAAALRLPHFQQYGWKISKDNLDTLPSDAPLPARRLVHRLLLAARARTLTEWFNAVCFEIKISNENINVIGYATKELLTQNGVPRNRHITTDDLQKEIWQAWDALISKSFDTQSRPNASAVTISEIPTASLSTILIGWLKSKKVTVAYVKSEGDSLSITIMPTGGSEGFSASDAMVVLDGLKTIGLQYEITSTRIRGTFNPIGAWTQRMSHNGPNMANVPTEDPQHPDRSIYSNAMRGLWSVPPGRNLIGVDAEGIQLRILAHYMDDRRFTASVIEGTKELGTDPHTLNKLALGPVCKSRDDAKTFIYAFLLGAGVAKISSILGCTLSEARTARDNFILSYPGLLLLKESVIPRDARLGYFQGLDGRFVKCGSEHHMLAGYLQNGEVIIMKEARILWGRELQRLQIPYMSVNFVHDEWQTEAEEDEAVCLKIAQVQADSIRIVGESLNLRCPMAGSYLNSHKQLAIGRTWAETH